LFSFSIYFTPPARRTARLKLLGECGGQVAVLGVGRGGTVADAVERLKPLVEIAEKSGVKVAAQNHGRHVLDSIASLREFVSIAASPALAPFHIMRRRESVVEAIKAVGSKLFYFYAWQNAPGMRQLPGNGTLDFRPVLKALREVGSGGYINVFTHADAEKEEMTRALVESRRYLQSLAAG